MVKAVVGANWGDEGKGKITDMLAEELTLSYVSRVEPMQDIQSLIIMENLPFIHYRQGYFMIIQQVSSEMV